LNFELSLEQGFASAQALRIIVSQEKSSPDMRAAFQKFEALCELHPVEYLPDMLRLLDETMTRFSRADKEYLAPDAELVRALERRSKLLLSKYAEVSEEKRKLIVGAVRYFILGVDETPDTEPIEGLDDDVFIMNHVLSKLGLDDNLIAPVG